jgi:histidine triad (HIT) family protein
MFHHEPPGYECPLCAVVAGGDSPLPFAHQSDVVLRTEHATAFINARWWPNNAGHVLVAPNTHVENIYDLLAPLSAHLQEAIRQVALALKHTYNCDGISTRQHNEPAGHQEVWHYHVHVFPRYEGDELYALQAHGRLTSPAERAPYAQRLRAYFSSPRAG